MLHRYPPTRGTTPIRNQPYRYPLDASSYGPHSGAGLSLVRYVTPRSMSTSGDLRAAHFRSLPACHAISRLPLFPVHLRDLPRVTCHHVPCPTFEIGPFHVETSLVCHPGPTVGFRITDENGTVVYLPDHEPALVIREGQWPEPEWISGYDLDAGADLLIHDAQYTDEEYHHCIGWGHSTYRQAFEFAKRVGAKELVPFSPATPHIMTRLWISCLPVQCSSSRRHTA